jgi:hypothetical protein
MRRTDLLRKGARLAFDHSGRLIEKAATSGEKTTQKFSTQTSSQYFRLKPLEKYYFKWMRVGADMRVNIYAVFASMVCFCVVFFPANWYDERQSGIQLKAKFDKNIMNKDIYEEFLYESGKKSRLDLDPFDYLITH